jgi:hypothetical protein
MKKVLLVSGCLLCLTASAAFAVGGAVNLGWDNCPSGVGYSNSKIFACLTNAGNNILVGSFVAPSFVDSANGNQMILDLQSSGALLPAWWRLGSTGCVGRTGQPTASFDFTVSPVGCFDYWAGAAAGGISYTNAFGGIPNRARISLVCAIDGTLAGPIAAGTEVYSFKVVVSNARTVGTALCAGCTDGVCIVLNSILITQNQRSIGGKKFLTTPGTNAAVTWNGGIPAGCYGATPAKNATWGSVKALYR